MVQRHAVPPHRQCQHRHCGQEAGSKGNGNDDGGFPPSFSRLPFPKRVFPCLPFYSAGRAGSRARPGQCRLRWPRAAGSPPAQPRGAGLIKH